MKKLYLILGLIAATFVGVAYSAQAAPIIPIPGGGTQTSTNGGFGSVAGNNGTSFCYVPSSTSGYVLEQSSTAQCGIAWVPMATSSSGGSNNATGTIYQGAVYNTTNTLIADSILNIPINFSSCGGDFGACVNFLYNSVSSTASSVSIMVPNLTLNKASWTTAINFGNNGESVNFICPGGANLKWGGVGTAVTFNFGNPTGHLVSQDYGCTYMGSSTLIAAGQTSNATTTGIAFGGSNGAVGIDFHDNNVNGFGHNVTTGANTYMWTFRDNTDSGGVNNATGSLLYIAPASNSGERFIITGNSFTDPANSTATNAIYISDNALASGFITNNSFDDASIYVGISNGIVDMNMNHFENAAFATYLMKYFIIASSSGATNLNVNDNVFALDNTGATGKLTEGIEEAVNLVFNDNIVENYGGASPITNFIDHSINAGQAVETACSDWSQNNAVSNWMQLTGVAYPGCFMEGQNSYPITMYTDGSNVGKIVNGQQNVATFDASGNWILLNNLNVGGSLNTTSTAIFHATTTFLGNVSTTIAANSFVATNGLGILIATNTPANTATGTAFNFPYWNASGTALSATSTIYQSSTVVLIGSNASSDYFGNVNTAGSFATEFDDYLNATTTLAFGTASTSIQISTTTGLSPTGMVDINNTEIAAYTSFTSAGTSSTINGLTRGLFGTTKQTNINLPVIAVPYVLAQNSSTQQQIAIACNLITNCVYGIRATPNTNSGYSIGSTVSILSTNSLSMNGSTVLTPAAGLITWNPSAAAIVTNIDAAGVPTIIIATSSAVTVSSTLTNIAGPFQLSTGSSTVTTPSIGGAIVSGGCDSATTTVDSNIVSSSVSFITTPTSNPGTTLGGTWAYSYLLSTGLIQTNVCSNVSVTPNSIPYIVKIIR